MQNCVFTQRKVYKEFKKGIARNYMAPVKAGAACNCSAFLCYFAIYFIKIVLYKKNTNDIIKEKDEY